MHITAMFADCFSIYFSGVDECLDSKCDAKGEKPLMSCSSSELILVEGGEGCNLVGVTGKVCNNIDNA